MVRDILNHLLSCRNPLVPPRPTGLLVPEGRPVWFKVFYKSLFPGEHRAGTLPRRAWHQIRTYPETWLEPYLDVHLSYPCLAASLNPSYSWLEPDLDVAGT